MIAVLIFVCSIIATKVKGAARQCSQCVFGPVSCFKASKPSHETEASPKMFKASGSAKPFSEKRVSTTQTSSESDNFCFDMFAVADIDAQPNIYNAQQIQPMQERFCSATKAMSSKSMIGSSAVCIHANVQKLTRRKQMCVLEIVANLEKHSYGYLLGR